MTCEHRCSSLNFHREQMYAWKASTLQLACWSVDSVYRIAWGRWGPPKAGERADRENGTVPRQSCTQDIVRFAPAEQPGTMSEIRGRIVGISKNNSPMLSLASIPVDYFAGGPQIWLVLSWCWTLLTEIFTVATREGMFDMVSPHICELKLYPLAFLIDPWYQQYEVSTTDDYEW